MAGKVDLELKRAFEELQKKQIETKQKLRIADIQIDSLKKTKQQAFITKSEINVMDPSTRTYDSIGRMFLLTPIGELKENLRKREVETNEQIISLESKKLFLAKSIEDASNNIRELIAQKRKIENVIEEEEDQEETDDS